MHFFRGERRFFRISAEMSTDQKTSHGSFLFRLNDYLGKIRTLYYFRSWTQVAVVKSNFLLGNYNYDLTTAADEKELELFKTIKKMDLGSFENLYIFYNYIGAIQDVPMTIERQFLTARKCIIDELNAGKKFDFLLKYTTSFIAQSQYLNTYNCSFREE